MHRKRYYKIMLYSICVVLACVLFERATLPDTTVDMKQQARTYGRMQEKEKPPKLFVYDGCTFFVDALLTSDFKQACLTHDIAYWYGGTKEERKKADKLLAEDIKETGVVGKIVSYPAYIAVRLFGDSILTRSVNAHWGFGWE